MEQIRTVGIIGAGRVGQTLARLAMLAGYHVLVAGSGAPVRTKRIVDMFAPGAQTQWAADVASNADLIFLCMPLGAYDELEPSDFVGRIVVDAMNYWPEADGLRDDLEDVVTTRVVANYLHGARVVKALNHVGYRDLSARAERRSGERRVAIAVAGDDADAVRIVRDVIDTLGFDTVVVGTLDESAVIQPDGDVFGAVLSADALRRRITEGR